MEGSWEGGRWWPRGHQGRKEGRVLRPRAERAKTVGDLKLFGETEAGAGVATGPLGEMTEFGSQKVSKVLVRSLDLIIRE